MAPVPHEAQREGSGVKPETWLYRLMYGKPRDLLAAGEEMLYTIDETPPRASTANRPQRRAGNCKHLGDVSPKANAERLELANPFSDASILRRRHPKIGAARMRHYIRARNSRA